MVLIRYHICHRREHGRSVLEIALNLNISDVFSKTITTVKTTTTTVASKQHTSSKTLT